MKTLILDGTFGNCEKLIDELLGYFQGDDVEVYNLRDKQIAYCTGCWSCWVKTPGLCAHHDDTQEMLKKVINSDRVIIFTENSAGYITSLSKKALEKFVPLVHPYIILVGESAIIWPDTINTQN